MPEAQAVNVGTIICLGSKSTDIIAHGTAIVTDITSCLNAQASSASALSADDQHHVRALTTCTSRVQAVEIINKIGDGHLRDGLSNLIGLINSPGFLQAIQLIMKLFGGVPAV